MPLPKYLHQRGDVYYVRHPIPCDVQPACQNGTKQVWRSLRTTSRKQAQAKAHAVLAELEAEFEEKRRGLHAEAEERAFVGSDAFDAALRGHDRIAGRMGTMAAPFARLVHTPEEAAAVAWDVRLGRAVRRPATRGGAGSSGHRAGRTAGGTPPGHPGDRR